MKDKTITKINPSANMTEFHVDQEILFGIVLDATLSFSVVYPAVYYVLEYLLRKLKKATDAKTGFQLKVGLTLFREEAETKLFSEGDSFTADIEEVIQLLQNIEFYAGGRKTGEILNEALHLQLSQLNRYQAKQSQHQVFTGILMLTDSVPEDGLNTEDYSNDAPGVCGEYRNAGLRCAYIYSYDDNYTPMLRMVDSNGRPTENGKNICVYGSLKELLFSDEESAKKTLDAMTEEIIEKFTI